MSTPVFPPIDPPLDLDAIEAVSASGTPGPWKHTVGEGCKVISGNKAGAYRQAQYQDIANTYGLANEKRDAENANKIVVAVNALPALVAEVRRLRALPVIETCAACTFCMPVSDSQGRTFCANQDAPEDRHKRAPLVNDEAAPPDWCPLRRAGTR